MARKTVLVEDVIGSANKWLAESDDERKDFRLGVIAMAEHVLIETGNYKGYSYNGTEFAKDDDVRDDLAPALRKGYDETRRHYFYR